MKNNLFFNPPVRFNIYLETNVNKAEDRIKTENLLKYRFQQIVEPIVENPNIAWSIIIQFYKKAFKEFYFRPAYEIKHLTRY